LFSFSEIERERETKELLISWAKSKKIKINKKLSFFVSSLIFRDPRILELLYEEARHNVLLGRYIMEPAHSIMLGGIQARIELGPYNVHTHTVSYFRWDYREIYKKKILFI
jgi:FERM central domain